MSSPATIVWFRQDLRLDDQPALRAAVDRGGPLIPVFLWTPGEEGTWRGGGASRWWLHHSLAALDAALRTAGSRLILRQGESALALLRALIRETGADAVFWGRRYEPAIVARDVTVKAELLAAGIRAESFNTALLHEPWTIRGGEGKPLRVFTPFWRRCLAAGEPAGPQPAPQAWNSPAHWPAGDELAALQLLPRIDWAAGMRAAWQPGEAGARVRLAQFVERSAEDYAAQRDRPDRAGVSRLSPHLHWGEISPRRVWHAVRAAAAGGRAAPQIAAPRPHEPPSAARSVEVFLRELGWREFAHHVLFHFPETTDKPLRAEFESFPWRRSAAALRAWQRGRTGYPLVDAGMRELWTTGWMHNRVRMVVASFLVKHLRIHWIEGARWFWDTLVDADLANNTLGWQWTAGCGADAAPYFRVFNPVLQGERFDPEGAYVRRWIPELARLPSAWIHRPWEAPAATVAAADLRLGAAYPAPIVEHAAARQAALDAFSAVTGRRETEDGS